MSRGAALPIIASVDFAVSAMRTRNMQPRKMPRSVGPTTPEMIYAGCEENDARPEKIEKHRHRRTTALEDLIGNNTGGESGEHG